MDPTRRRMAAGLLFLGGMVGLRGAALASEKVVDEVLTYQTVLTQIDDPCSGYNHFAVRYRSEDGVTEMTSAERHLLVGHGTAPSFTLRFTVRAVYVGGTIASVEVPREDTECRS